MSNPSKGQDYRQGPHVSVIIPTYNRAHIVPQAIQSVLNQSYQEFEIIVVDDASTDNTGEVIKSFRDSRIRYIRQNMNHGAPTARNLGAKVARGEYLAFLDSDDVWYTELLRNQLNALSGLSPDVGFVYCGMVRKEGENISVMGPGVLGETFDDLLTRANGICTSSLVIRRVAFQAVNGFDVELASFQDFGLLLRLMSKYRNATVDDVLLEYRVGDDSISLDMTAKAEGLRRIIKCYRNDILRLRLMHQYLFRVGQYRVLSGRLRAGWLYWIRALQHKPLYLKPWKHMLVSLGGVGVYTWVLTLHRKRMELRKPQSLQWPDSD